MSSLQLIKYYYYREGGVGGGWLHINAWPLAGWMTGRASEISEADERSEGSSEASLAGASQPR